MNIILDVLNNLGFNWHVALANFVNFLIVLYILNIFIFKKIKNNISHRDNLIKQGLSDAEQSKKDRDNIEEERLSVIHKAEKDGHALIDVAHSKGEHIVAQAKEKADLEADKIKAEAEKIKAAAKAEAEKEFALKAKEIVVSLTKKALKENMTGGDNNNLIARITQ